MKVYFDNAATTPIHPEVVKVMADMMLHNYGNPSSIHAQGREVKTLIEDARRTVAKYREQLNIPVARLRKIL